MRGIFSHSRKSSPLFLVAPKFLSGFIYTNSFGDFTSNDESSERAEFNRLKKKHSVMYWMMASLVYEGCANYENREAVRVLDPEFADVFFVPFFSSLSINTHGHNMIDLDTEIDCQLQVDVLKYLRQSSYWEASQDRDHVIPMYHPNAFKFLKDQINYWILIVADFGRYYRIVSILTQEVVAPYVHVVDSFRDDFSPDPYESHSILLFFRGRTAKKDERIVQAKLKKILAGYQDVHYENSYANDQRIKVSSEEMRLSKFCLTLAGDTPSSNRMFDAITSHCVSVIMSDKIELPFEVKEAREMKTTGFVWNFKTYNVLITGLYLDGMTDDGMKILELMEEENKQGFRIVHMDFEWGPYLENGMFLCGPSLDR